MAVGAIRGQRGLLRNLFRHCLPTLADALFSEGVIPEDLKMRACNMYLDANVRSVELLDCIEARVRAVPSDFTKFIGILKEERLFESQPEELIRRYCELPFRCDSVEQKLVGLCSSFAIGFIAIWSQES